MVGQRLEAFKDRARLVFAGAVALLFISSMLGPAFSFVRYFITHKVSEMTWSGAMNGEETSLFRLIPADAWAVLIQGTVLYFYAEFFASRRHWAWRTIGAAPAVILAGATSYLLVIYADASGDFPWLGTAVLYIVFVRGWVIGSGQRAERGNSVATPSESLLHRAKRITELEIERSHIAALVIIGAMLVLVLARIP